MSKEQVSVPASLLVEAVRNLLKFPYSRICKHLVVADLLSILEQHGVPITEETVKAVIIADDETALRELAILQDQVSV